MRVFLLLMVLAGCGDGGTPACDRDMAEAWCGWCNLPEPFGCRPNGEIICTQILCGPKPLDGGLR